MSQREKWMKIEMWYREMYPLLLLYGWKMLGNDSLAEEAVQETFRIACEKVRVLERSPNPQGWLMNTMKNVLRTTKRERDLLKSMILESKAYEDQQRNAQTKETMEDNIDLYYGDMVSAEEFELLKRLVIKQETVKEIAEELGISYEACKKRIQRARQKMRDALRQV